MHTSLPQQLRLAQVRRSLQRRVYPYNDIRRTCIRRDGNGLFPTPVRSVRKYKGKDRHPVETAGCNHYAGNTAPVSHDCRIATYRTPAAKRQVRKHCTNGTGYDNRPAVQGYIPAQRIYVAGSRRQQDLPVHKYGRSN